MPEQPWVDYYETLQLSPSADRETIERVYRLLAKRYHPDNDVTGDADLFNEVRSAYEILTDPDSRAAYDASYERDRSEQWQVFRQDTADSNRSDDQRLFHAVLSLLRMLAVPREHLDFPLWYLKKRNYLEVLENGLLAISVDGVDKLGSGDLALPADRLLPDSTAVRRGAGDQRDPRALPDPTHSG
jgi:curved DNA-binding protein CbpA